MTDQSQGGHWVIEHTSEFIRRWWTGSDWTEDYQKAKWYETEPDIAHETLEEEAKAVYYATHEMESG